MCLSKRYHYYSLLLYRSRTRLAAWQTHCLTVLLTYCLTDSLTGIKTEISIKTTLLDHDCQSQLSKRYSLDRVRTLSCERSHSVFAGGSLSHCNKRESTLLSNSPESTGRHGLDTLAKSYLVIDCAQLLRHCFHQTCYGWGWEVSGKICRQSRGMVATKWCWSVFRLILRMLRLSMLTSIWVANGVLRIRQWVIATCLPEVKSPRVIDYFETLELIA